MLFRSDSTGDVEVVEVQEDQVEADEETATKEASDGQSATVGPVDASRTALGAHPGTQVVSVSLERVRGVSAWEVEVVSEEGQWEVSVDAVTGEIILEEVEHSDDLAEDLSLLAAASLDFEEAITAVLDAVPGGSLVELDAGALLAAARSAGVSCLTGLRQHLAAVLQHSLDLIVVDERGSVRQLREHG